MAVAEYPRASQSSHPVNRIVRYLSPTLGKGFLYSKDFNWSYAFFNDKTHQFLPGSAENKDKVVNYVPPPQLTTTDYTKRVLPSHFSGLMRIMVGSYHRAGKDAPFSAKWPKTHGLMKSLVNVTPTTADPFPAPVPKYWLVEVSPDGLYVAPVEIRDNFASLPSVERYMPTTSEVAANPGLQVYRDQLSLQWAHGNKNPGQLTVLKLLDANQLSAAYANCTPFFGGHGWAFSRSGKLIQQAGGRFSGTPAAHYRCSRYLIQLRVNAYGVFAEDHVAVGIEREQIYTPWIDNPLWIPTSPANWTGLLLSGIAPPGTGELAGSQSPAVFVYYDGEQEQVHRHVRAEQAAMGSYTTPPVRANSTQEIPWNGVFFGVNDPELVEACPNDYTSATAVTVKGGSGENNSAYNAVNGGWTLSGYSAVQESYSAKTRQTNRTRTEELGPLESYYGNFYSVQPRCQYTNAAGQPVPTCDSQFHNANHCIAMIQDTQSFSEQKQALAGLVLFMEEREAALVVYRNMVTQTGTQRIGDPSSFTGYYVSQYKQIDTKIDGGPCPWDIKTTFNVNPGFDAYFPGWVRPEVIIGEFTNVTQFRQYALVMPGIIYSAAYPATNFNLETFTLLSPSTKPTAQSNVFVMRGNMREADKTLTPENQTLNSVFLVEKLTTNGGFELPKGSAISFVGKA